MALLHISVDHNPIIEGIVNIGDKLYMLRYQWNTEGEFATLSFYDGKGNPIVKGVKVVLGINIIKNYEYNNELPDTPIFIYRLDASDNAPKQWEMGNIVKIGYFA